MAFFRKCQIHLVLHLCGLSECSQQSAKPKPQKADLAVLTSLRELLKRKKKKRQQYLCLAFFKKKTKNKKQQFFKVDLQVQNLKKVVLKNKTFTVEKALLTNLTKGSLLNSVIVGNLIFCFLM